MRAEETRHPWKNLNLRVDWKHSQGYLGKLKEFFPGGVLADLGEEDNKDFTVTAAEENSLIFVSFNQVSFFPSV